MEYLKGLLLWAVVCAIMGTIAFVFGYFFAVYVGPALKQALLQLVADLSRAWAAGGAP